MRSYRVNALVFPVLALMFLMLNACGSKSGLRRQLPNPTNGQSAPQPTTDPYGGLPLLGSWQTNCIASTDFYGPYKVGITFAAGGQVTYTLSFYSDAGVDGTGGCQNYTDGGSDPYTVVVGTTPLTAPSGARAFDLTDGTGTDFNVIAYTKSGNVESFQLGDEYSNVDYSGLDADHRPQTLYAQETFYRVATPAPAPAATAAH